MSERALGDVQRRSDQRAEERRDGDEREPPEGGRATSTLAHDERDGVDPVGEVVGDDGEEDEDSGLGVEPERKSDPQAVRERVKRESGGPEGADVAVGTRLCRIVAVVEDEEALRDEEEEESR